MALQSLKIVEGPPLAHLRIIFAFFRKTYDLLHSLLNVAL